ncbi:MAG: DNA gyrase inhibitor YacG [Bacteriovoracaceae bacterium]
MKYREVKCPTCKKKFDYFSSEFRPFCCEKCWLIDLGQWLSESYSVPAEKLTPDELETLENLHNEENSSEEEDQEDDSLQ